MDFLTTVPALTATEKTVRELFVNEFLKDHDYYAASVRCGYISELALEFAKEMQGDPYVQKTISDREILRRGRVTPDQLGIPAQVEGEFIPHSDEFDKERIISGLFREAHYKGPGASHAARVNALGKLATIYRLGEVDSQSGDELTGVMVIPSTNGIADWETYAREQQEHLKQTVRD